MNLEFNVNNQIIKRIDSEKVISKSRNIYTAIFNFIDTTENLFIDENIFVIFQDSWGKRKTIFLGKYNSALSCNVPNDVLKGTYFKISIYAGDLVTTNIVTIPLIESNYSTCDTIQEEDYYKDIFVEIFNKKWICLLVIMGKIIYHYYRDGQLFPKEFLVNPCP